jgi:hypothetical protein
VNTNSGLNNCYISSFAIDEFGNIYMCLRNHQKYSLFVREADGSVTPFYTDENILPNTVEKLIWGNSRYLYLSSSSLHALGSTLTDAPGRIYRMAMDRNGAPYQGRKFLNQ